MYNKWYEFQNLKVRITHNIFSYFLKEYNQMAFKNNDTGHN